MFIMIDNFYRNAIETREFALTCDFNVKGNYPGARTAPCTGEYVTSIIKEFENILNRKITYWPDQYNTSFQVTTSSDTTWIHHDGTTEWAAVIYLTPDAPIDSGTGIYRHKPTGIFMHDPKNDIDFNETPTNESDWEIIASAGNIFNRLVLYKGSYYHRSIVPGFGSCKEDGRLFQTFFFNT
jgi:hypothetical protein